MLPISHYLDIGKRRNDKDQATLTLRHTIYLSKWIVRTSIVHSIHIKLCGILVHFGWKMVEIMWIIVSHEIASGWLSGLTCYEKT